MCAVVSRSSWNSFGSRGLLVTESRCNWILIICFSRYRPMLSYFSNPNPIGSIKVWQEAQLLFARCIRNRSLLVSGLSLTAGKLVSTPGGGGGTFWQRKCSRTNSPRAVGDVSDWLAVSVNNPACPNTPARLLPAGYFIIPNSSAGGS